MTEKADWGPDEKTIKASERISFLVGKKVFVRTCFVDRSGNSNEVHYDDFNAIYLDLFPLGREYFFKFERAGVIILVGTKCVNEILELPA